MTTTTVRTTAQATPAPRPATLGSRLAALLQQARVRRADRSDLARQIAAYPAARGVSPVVLPINPR